MAAINLDGGWIAILVGLGAGAAIGLFFHDEQWLTEIFESFCSPTRYAVHVIPLPGDRTFGGDNASTDINERQIAVGYYQDAVGRYVGYVYDGQTGILETADQMLDLSSLSCVQ